MFLPLPIFLVPRINPIPFFDRLVVFRQRGTKNTGYAWLSPDTFQFLVDIVNPIKCKQTIQVRLLVILQSKSRGGLIYIDFIIIFVILKNQRYSLYHCILNQDDNLYLIYFSYLSVIIIFLTNFESVISCNFCRNISKQSKNYIKFYFNFLPTLEL